MSKVNRRTTMDPLVAGIFHITSKCVRGAFLCGKDARTGKDYSYRKEEIKKRVEELASLFAIAIGWQAVLSNHLHLLLANLPHLVASWSDEEVLRRVCKIFPYKFKRLGVVDKEPTAGQIAEFSRDRAFMAEMRSRLSDPSWFMRQLLQQLAVRFNAEDDCKGHFVEQRFDHRVITDERGVLICGIYIDLNEVAAKIVDRPERSMNTSAGMRIAARALRAEGKHAEAQRLDGHLLPISTNGDGQEYPPVGSPDSKRAQDVGFLETTLDRYLNMLDVMGRQTREGKRGKIPGDLPPILERLELDHESLLHMVENYNTYFPNVVGSAASVAELSETHDGLWSQQADAVAELERTLSEDEPKKRRDPKGTNKKSRRTRGARAKKKRK